MCLNLNMSTLSLAIPEQFICSNNIFITNEICNKSCLKLINSSCVTAQKYNF